MTKKFTFLTFSFFLFGIKVLFAQLPPICPITEPPADICSRACVYCNINGLTSTTVGYTGQQPSSFCGVVENEQWIGFVAGASDATFNVVPNDCANNDGLQVAVYPSCDGAPLACDFGCMGCGAASRPLSVTGMIPGETYYLVVDGYLGDECNFTVTASPALAVTPPIPSASLRITGPSDICEGGVFEYCAEPISGIVGYEWTAPPDALINGQPSPVFIENDQPGAGECVTISFGSQSGVICVRGINACFQSPPTCILAEIAPDVPTVLADTAICAEDTPYNSPWGASVTQTGLYTGNLVNPNMCDSTVIQFVRVKLDIPTQLPPSLLCPTETMNVCGQTYPGNPGPYTTTCTRSDGCDSTVNFIIVPRAVPPTIVPPTTLCEDEFLEICGNKFYAPGTFNYTCIGPSGCDSVIVYTIIKQPLDPEIFGAADLSCKNANTTLGYPTGPGTPTWYADYQVAPVGTDTTLNVYQEGEYILELTYSVGLGSCSVFDTVNIAEDFDKPTADPVNASIGCGIAAMIGVNTNANPASFNWSGPVSSTTAQFPTVSTAGSYMVTVTDDVNGCTETATVMATGNIDIPQLSVSGANIDCSNTSAMLSATSTVPNATFAWSTFQNTSNISVSSGGNYTVTVTDPSNNCTNEMSVFVNENTDVPDIAASASGLLTCGNTAVNLNSSSMASGLAYNWSTSETSPNISVNAPGTYNLTVTDTNGCTNSTSVTVNEDIGEPGVSVNGGTLTCLQNSLALTANTSSAGATFDWGAANNNQTFQVNSVGTYTVTVTGTNGCTSAATATVNSDFAEPNASAAGGFLTCVMNSVNLSGNSSTGGVSYEWTGPNGGIYSGQNPSVSEAGNYTLTVTASSNGCTATSTAAVTPDLDIPDASASGGTLDCAINSISLNGVSTTPNAILNWSGPTGALTGTSPMVSNPGTYTLTVEDPSNGCTAVANTTVVEDVDVPQFSLSGGQLSCNQTNLQVQLIPAAGQGNLTYDWSGAGGLTSTDQNPSVSQAGLYTVIVTGDNGCTNTESVTVTADTEIPQTDIQGGTLTCAQNDVQVQLTVTSTGTVTSIEWSDATGTVVSTVEDPMLSVSGVYTVVVTTDNGCTSTSTATIDEDYAEPMITASGGLVTCATTMTGLSANSPAGQSYSWTGPNGFSSSDQNPTVMSGGDYTVEVTGANGCTATEMVTVSTDYAEPDIMAMGGTVSCSVLTTDLTASSTAGQSYMWTGPNGFSSNDQNPSVQDGGTYTVEVTGSNGCTALEMVIVVADLDQPDITALGGQISCDNPTTSLTANSQAGVSYIWMGPNGFTSMDQNPTADEEGTYTVVVTGPNGCTNSESTTISSIIENAMITIAPPLTITCTMPTIGLDATIVSPSGSTIASTVWSSANGFSSTDEDPMNVTDNGIYELIVTTLNGCTTTATVEVLEDNLPPGVATFFGSLDCNMTQTEIEATSLTTNAEFEWTGPTGTLTGGVHTVSTPGNYMVIATNPINGCTSEAEALVLEDVVAPDITLMSENIGCLFSTVVIDAESITPNVSYLWSGGLANVQDPTVVAGGTYTVTVTDPANGCTSTEDITILESTVSPNLTVENAEIPCDMPNVALTANSTVPSVEFEWYLDGVVISNDQNPSVSEVGTYTVIATDPLNGCTSEEDVLVSMLDAPQISAVGGMISCDTPSIMLSGSSTNMDVSFMWSGPGTFTSADANPMVDSAGQYILVVTDNATGCTSEEMVEVLGLQSIPTGLQTVVKNISCFGEVDGSISINGVQGGTPPYMYSFDAQPFADINEFDALEAGAYPIVVQDAAGCEFTTVYMIEEPEELSLDLGTDLIIGRGDSLDLQADILINFPDRIESFIVSPNELYDFICDTCSGGFFSFFSDTDMEVTIVDSNGCEAVDTRLISVVDSASIYVPNIINPQGVLENSRLTVFATTTFVTNIKSFRIYNRLGKLMHTGTNFPPNTFDQSWDGYYDGKRVNSAVYVWIADIEFSDGHVETHIGDVTVVGQ